jgi:hypothetical protein
MLMQTFGLDAQQAFAALVSMSQNTSSTLRDVADHILDALTAPAPDETRQATLDTLRTVQHRLRGHDRPPQQPPTHPADHS